MTQKTLVPPHQAHLKGSLLLLHLLLLLQLLPGDQPGFRANQPQSWPSHGSHLTCNNKFSKAQPSCLTATYVTIVCALVHSTPTPSHLDLSALLHNNLLQPQASPIIPTQSSPLKHRKKSL